MEGNDKILGTLNELLADELTAINQYMVQSEMCADWGYEKLHEAIEKRAVDEMKHAEELIGRILFLEGKPIVSNLNKINIGATVDAQHKNDQAAEEMAIKTYNDGIKLAVDVAIIAHVNYLKKFSKMKKNILTGSKHSLTRLNKWGCKFTLESS